MVLAQPVATTIGGTQAAGLKVTTHSPTARELGSTEGGGSLVMTGFLRLVAGVEEPFVLGESWALARDGKTSAHSKVNAKTQVLLEDF
jgi:hypothetical protein